MTTLGYSHRVYAQAFRHTRQSAWLEGIGGAIRHFGGLPGEVLLDNARALVKHHDIAMREVEFTDRLRAIARYWDVRPVACAPHRTRTKGKNERGVGYVHQNAIAGRNYRRASSLDGRPPFCQLREPTRRMQIEPGGLRENDACVDIDNKYCSVPWRLIGAEVSMVVSWGEIRIHHAGTEVACHDRRLGRRERAVERAHLHGIVAGRREMPGDVEAGPAPSAGPPPDLELLRPLAEYEQVAGGGW